MGFIPGQTLSAQVHQRKKVRADRIALFICPELAQRRRKISLAIRYQPFKASRKSRKRKQQHQQQYESGYNRHDLPYPSRRSSSGPSIYSLTFFRNPTASRPSIMR